MINKIVKLTGIGMLHEPLSTGAISLRQKTVIFGENGSGKSTFVAVLRSLVQGTGDAIRGRKTIGGKQEQRVEFLIGNNKHLFQQGTWNQGHESISIFDATFVAENVYTGNSVDTDHRKNLLSFALGATGVKLARKVDALAVQISDDGRAEREAALQVQSHISGQMSPEVFAELPEPSKDAESKLITARSELAAQEQASTVRELQKLTTMSFDGPKAATITDVLALSIESVSKGATTRLREHQEESGVSEEWLMEGHKHCSNGSCPFCEQPLAKSEIISTYEACFSEAYRVHRDYVVTTLSSMEKTVSIEVEESLRHVADLNSSRALAWRQFIENDPIQFDMANASTILEKAQEALRNVYGRKTTDPLEVVTLTEGEAGAVNALQSLVTNIDEYNAQIAEFNVRIQSVKDSAESNDLESAQAKVDYLLNQIERHRETTKLEVVDWLQRCGEKKKHEEEKVKARAELDKYSAGIPAWLAKSANDHLKGCGTHFKLSSMKQVYTGAKPRFEYVIEMRGRPVDLTGKTTDGISFGTAMSQGDKSALAFAFFLARLENDPTLAEQIVVFDDPLSSLDTCRRRYTRKKIAELAKRVSQMIVLTHEESTVAEIVETLSESECCILQLRDQNDFSIFLPTSVKELTASEYVKCFDRMQHFLQGSGIPESVVKDIRPYLEMNLRYRFPEHLKPEPLGKMIGQIREAKGDSSLVRMQTHVKMLTDINEYCTDHSHGDGALENVEKIVSSDLKAIIKNALEFARGFPM